MPRSSSWRPQNKIPVIAYDRLIEDPSVLYLSFNNTDVGKAEATAMLKQGAEGNYVLIKGDPGDANATTFLPAGWDEAGLKAARRTTCKIKILADGTYTDAWDTTKAQNNMEAIIDEAIADKTPIDAVLAENDSTALGVVQAPKAKSYGRHPGQRPGRRHRQPAERRCRPPVRGRLEERQRARQGRRCGCRWPLCKDPTIAERRAPGGPHPRARTLRPGATRSLDFTTPGDNVVKSVILNVQPVTQENLQLILDAKWLDKKTLCKNATDPANSGGGLQVVDRRVRT